ncbi:hypothetical protein GJAV_G00133250 [Gymnothorax javanicus]|nr:hypothetical protein GJAV_G00133250 [Gymnothorax javanicus]
MRNASNSPEYGWEYYNDYVDPIIVDESKLKFNKYSIVIIFWIGMAGFAVVLVLILLHLARSGKTNLGHHSKKLCVC